MRRCTTGIFILALTLTASALHAQAGDPPSRAARISALTGTASLQPAGATDWSDAALNYTVTTGDRIYTPAGGRMELEIGPMSVRLSENSDVTVTNLTDGFMQLGVEQGTVRLSVYRLARGDSIEIDTPNGAVMVGAVGEYRVDVPDDDRFSTVSVDQGSAEIVGPGVDQIVRGGQAVQLSGTDNIRAISVPRPAPISFDSWAMDRDHRLESAGCARYMNRDIPGCADLDENGQWDTNPAYGAVWYPSHVSADWVPYRYGRWVWIDPWGWSWVEDEPWGYAPFHYGRWTQIGSRWGWIPGPIQARPYYAPALVAFVGGAGWSIGVNIGTQAWFPLGPREAYIPSYHHDDNYLRQVNISNVRNVTNISAIINVTNVNQVRYVNRNAGMTAVPTDVFRAGRPVSKAVVQVAPENRGRGSIISHPSAAPTPTAALGGRPATAPPRAAPRPPMITTESPRRGAPDRGPPDRGGPPQRGQPAQAQPPRGQPAPVQPQPQPAAQPPRTEPQRGNPQANEPPRGRPAPVPPVAVPTPAPSPAAPPIAPEPRRAEANPNQPRQGRAIITRTAPPPAAPPFEAKAPALNDHPGKPLEPQQTNNVRQGRPAGPPKDPETVDHRIVVPPAPAARAPIAAPPKANPTPVPAPAAAAPPPGQPQKAPPPNAGRGR
ncbi:MAG TPA: DUF6600 domain-containing protein, partial [Gemmatimonadaceae bacterium]|nr:DUF6600 domain-containing protein [Gemmatimonadaceae bacterium]